MTTNPKLQRAKSKLNTDKHPADVIPSTSTKTQQVGSPAEPTGTITVKIPKALRTEFKMVLLKNEKSMTQFFTEQIEEYIQSHKAKE